MKSLDVKTIGVAIVLLFVALVSYIFWGDISPWILTILNTPILTFIIWLVLGVLLFSHFRKNKTIKNGLISDKDGLEKPFDYIQSWFTYGVIGTSIQTLSREVFARLNFPELSGCLGFSDFDSLSFGGVIIVLAIYLYAKIQPIVEEDFFIHKNKIKPNTNEDI